MNPDEMFVRSKWDEPRLHRLYRSAGQMDSPVCENCAQMYKPEPKLRTPNPQAHKEQ